MGERYSDAEIGARNLRHNRLWQGAREGVGETKHTPPAQGHYPDIFYWDSIFAAIVSARAATDGQEALRWLHASQDELTVVSHGIRPDGFLPNLRFAGKTRGFDPERILALERSATSTNYTQPPVFALGVREAHDATLMHGELEARQFLSSIYPRLRDHYGYFEEQLGNGPDDKLIGIYHPHMTGRDSDPTFDNLKPHRLPRRGVDTPAVVDKLNIALDYADILRHGIRLRRARGDMERMRREYWVNDVMMNAIYVDNLREMADLALRNHDIADSRRFSKLADTVERQILDKLWFPDARGGQGAFYALDGNGESIQEISVSNLFPLVLPNLGEQQLESLLDLMDSSFNTPFPLPSVSTESRNYDPHNRESERLWRGPTWINTNWYIAERGLQRQAARPELASRDDLQHRCRVWTNRIALGSRALVGRDGLCEHYDPISGDGQRKRVKNFAWSNLAYLLDPIDT